MLMPQQLLTQSLPDISIRGFGIFEFKNGRVLSSRYHCGKSYKFRGMADMHCQWFCAKGSQWCEKVLWLYFTLCYSLLKHYVIARFNLLSLLALRAAVERQLLVLTTGTVMEHGFIHRMQNAIAHYVRLELLYSLIAALYIGWTWKNITLSTEVSWKYYKLLQIIDFTIA